MQTYQFYGKYANVPMSKRGAMFDTGNQILTLNEIYHRVKELDDEMRPKVIERDNLVEIASKYIEENQA